MKPHHFAWLKAHPERTQAWLEQALEQGFDVHHLDEDHENNDPENLVLMEHTDHFRLHWNWDERVRPSEAYRLKGSGGRWFSDVELAEYIKAKLSKGEQAYQLKQSFPDRTWKQVGQEIGYAGKKNIVMKTIAVAKQWALYHGKKWPLHG